MHPVKYLSIKLEDFAVSGILSKGNSKTWTLGRRNVIRMEGLRRKNRVQLNRDAPNKAILTIPELKEDVSELTKNSTDVWRWR